MLSTRLAADPAVVLRKMRREPLPPQDWATWQYTVRDNYVVQRVAHSPAQYTAVVTVPKAAPLPLLTSPAGYVAMFGADGTPLWERAGSRHQSLDVCRFTDDGGALLRTQTDPVRLLHIRADGQIKWRFEAPAGATVDSVVPQPNGTTMIKMGQSVHRLDARGRDAWSATLPAPLEKDFHVVAPDGSQLLVGVREFPRQYFVITPRGHEKHPRLPDICTAPIVVDDKVIYGGRGGQLHGVGTSYWVGWGLSTDAAEGLGTPWCGRDGNIYVEGKVDKTSTSLYAVSPQGQLKWQLPVAESQRHGSARFEVDFDGMVYFSNDEANRVDTIQPNGRLGNPIEVRPGVSSICAGGNGKLYVWRGDNALAVHDIASGGLMSMQLDVPPGKWSLQPLRPGFVELVGESTVYQMRTDRDIYLERALKELAESGPPPPTEALTVRRDNEWVVIGGVRVPVRR